MAWCQAEGEGDYIDLSEHDTVSFRVFGDGRKYIANFRTENWIVGSRNHDVWQAFLFARRGQGTGQGPPENLGLAFGDLPGNQISRRRVRAKPCIEALHSRYNTE
jgi:hypothetical protein